MYEKIHAMLVNTGATLQRNRFAKTKEKRAPIIVVEEDVFGGRRPTNNLTTCQASQLDSSYKDERAVVLVDQLLYISIKKKET